MELSTNHLNTDGVNTAPTVVRPTILIDIDGVINVNDHIEYWPDLKYGPKEHIAHSPAIIAKINSWSEIADCRMLTSWQEKDIHVMANKIKLNKFPVLPYVNSERPSKVELAMQVMDEIGPDALLIHIDDHMWHWFDYYNKGKDKGQNSDRRMYFERPNTLYLSPFCGLTHAQAELVDAVLADESEWKGKQLFEIEPGKRPSW